MGISVLTLEIQISMAVLAILLLRLGMKKLPKVYSYGLWLLVFVRLLCPFSLESRFGFMPSREESGAWMEQIIHKADSEEIDTVPGTVSGSAVVVDAGGENRINTVDEGSTENRINAPGGNMSEDRIKAGENGRAAAATVLQNTASFYDNAAGGRDSSHREQGKRGLNFLLLGLWASGLAGVLGCNGAALFKVRRRMKKACPLWDNVYVAPDIPSPFTMGIFRPRIYLPPDLGRTEREYILCHEMVHIHRKDYLVKNVAFLLTAVHWFNPFVWVAFFLMERDMEMSCDEKVIRLMGADIKKRYSQSLLDFAAGKQSIAVTPLTFGENGVKQRVKNVLSYKNARRWSLLSGILILAAVGVSLFTTRAQGEEDTAGALKKDMSAAPEADNGKEATQLSGGQKTPGNLSVGQMTTASGQSADTDRPDPEEVLNQWENAFMNRDMDTLLDLAYDREQLLATAEGSGGEERFFGASADWPSQYLALWDYRQEDGTGKIRVYFHTSEPEVFIVDETVRMVEKEGSYYVDHQELTEYFEIGDKEQFESLYGSEGAYDFGWKNTGYSTGFYRIILQHLIEGGNTEPYKQYTDPVDAAVKLLHLGPGEGKAAVSPAVPESEEAWMSYLPEGSLPEGSLAVVEYTFSEDGSRVEIPMELIEGSCGIWAPAGTGMVRQIYRVNAENDHAVAECFGWDEEEIFYLQASQYGIYRVDKDYGLSCIYPYYIHPDTIWALQDGLMYVSLYGDESQSEWDSYYFEDIPSGTTDYNLEAIGIVDVRTGEFDRESMKLSGKTGQRMLRRPLKWISLGGGFVHLYKTEPDGGSTEYDIPMMNMGCSSLTEGPMWKGKPVTELKDGEVDAYGKAVRERLLEYPGMLLELSNRAPMETYTYIDMDGDGKAEKISLSRDTSQEEERYWAYDNYLLQAGESRITDSAECLNNGIWAVSLDGSEILLALYEDGPSNDPATMLYALRDGKLVSAGGFADDIRACTIENGIIYGIDRRDVLQTNWVKAAWRMGSDGSLEWVEQESYDFTGQNEITLLVQLPVRKEPVDGAEVHMMKPQKVRFLKTDSSFSWIYAQGADGDGGWFQVDGIQIAGLGADHYEVFEGLNFAD